MASAQSFIFALELVGTAAFAASGAQMGVRKNMDILGVLVLALTTALGGGVLRDVILGIHPPRMFEHGVYAAVALAAGLALFFAVRWRWHHPRALSIRWLRAYDRTLNFLDALGLGIFTVVGVNTAISVGMGDNAMLLIFVGVCTGVGGGVLRDVLAQETPAIFVKQIYACASCAGALLYVFAHGLLPEPLLALLATALVLLVRLLSLRYDWNLPRCLPRRKQ